MTEKRFLWLYSRFVDLLHVFNFTHLPVTSLLHRESKKTRHQTLGHNFTNYYPIFNFFSLADSVVNLQQIRV